jgi:phage gpG-like protein
LIKVDFDAPSVFDKLKSVGDALGDLTPLHQDIREYMVEATRQRFRDGKGPDGVAWKPKSQLTLTRYLERGDGNRPDPLIGPSGRLGREIVGTADKTAAEIGSALEYSGVMQRGAAKGAFGRDSRNHPLPWGDIPARVWLGISEADEAAIIDIADEYLEGAIGAD